MLRKFGIGAECLGKIPQKIELIKSAGFETVFTGSYTLKDVEIYKKYSDRYNLDYSFIHAPFGNINSMWLEGEEYLAIYNEMKESGVINKTALVYGQMNEPPGARMRVALSGLTMAEYFSMM